MGLYLSDDNEEASAGLMKWQDNYLDLEVEVLDISEDKT